MDDHARRVRETMGEPLKGGARAEVESLRTALDAERAAHAKALEEARVSGYTAGEAANRAHLARAAVETGTERRARADAESRLATVTVERETLRADLEKRTAEYFAACTERQERAAEAREARRQRDEALADIKRFWAVDAKQLAKQRNDALVEVDALRTRVAELESAAREVWQAMRDYNADSEGMSIPCRHRASYAVINRAARKLHAALDGGSDGG